MQAMRIGAALLFLAVTQHAAAVEAPLPHPRLNRAQLPPDAPGTPSIAPAMALSLSDAIFIGLQNNTGIESAHLARIREKFDLVVAEGQFRPKVKFDATLVHDATSAKTNVDISPGVVLRTTTGARFELAWKNSAVIGEQESSYLTVLDLGVEQPLLRGAGVGINMAPLQIATLENQNGRLRLTASVSETIAKIIAAHRELVMAEQGVGLAEQSQRRAEELLTINAALIAAGRMATVETAQTRFDIESKKLRVLEAKYRVQLAQMDLANLLSLPLDRPLIATEILDPAKLNMDIEHLIDVALRNRPDFLIQQNVVAQRHLGLDVAEDQQLWDLSIFAKAEMRAANSSLSGSAGGENLSVGIKLHGTLDDLDARRNAVEASSGLALSEVRLRELRSGIELQVRKSVSTLNLLWAKIAAAKNAKKLAEEALAVELDKLNAGRSSTFQVRTAQQSLDDLEMDILVATVDYLNEVALLDLNLGTGLTTWQISLADTNAGFLR